MTAKKKIKQVCPRCGSKYKAPCYVVITESSVCPSCFSKERELRAKHKKDRKAACKRRRENKRKINL